MFPLCLALSGYLKSDNLERSDPQIIDSAKRAAYEFLVESSPTRFQTISARTLAVCGRFDARFFVERGNFGAANGGVGDHDSHAARGNWFRPRSGTKNFQRRFSVRHVRIGRVESGDGEKK